MESVKIVTDSTADIPDDLVEELGIGVVHDYINFGIQSLRDKVDISRSEFYARLLIESEVPTTAAPGVGEFERVYRSVGAPEVSIISLHPPANLSVLYNTAHLAAQSFPKGRVTAIDTGQISMGLGWLVIAAAKAAQAGASVARIVDLVRSMQPRARVLAVLDTLKFLRRGGRVSWAQALVGALLRIKPMLEVYEGQILPLDRVRTGRRAMDRLVELTAAMSPLESLAVLHSAWYTGAEELRQRLVHLCPNSPVLTVDVTPVIGVHVGPNALGVAAIVALDPLDPPAPFAG